jgi:hypothetical protein
MKDLGQLHHFLGMTIEPRQTGLLLHQRQYALDILERVGMTDCKPCSTPIDTQAKLSVTLGDPVTDPTAYESLAGALQYLTFTRPDLTYVVQQICLHMHDPRESHLATLKCLLRYVCGTVDFDLVLHRSPSAELVIDTDTDWVGCPDTRRSTSGYAVFLGGNLISWSSKRQPVVSRSSAEVEYRAVANGVAEASWLRQLLVELHSPLTKSTPSTATTSAPCTSPPTRFSISVRSMWRLTCTSFVTGWLLVMFGFSLYRPPPSSLTYSPRVFLPRPSRSSGPAST